MEANKFLAVTGNSHIPQEILFDILARIPSVKSLLRFRCVSKSFCSLMSQPSFIEAHHQKAGSSSDHLFVSFPGYQTRQTFISNLDDEKKIHKYNQLGSSLFEYLNEPCFLKLRYFESLNGLVCLWNYYKDVAICNPFTRQHVFLPTPVKKVEHRLITCCSLGFDPTTKKHKVVRAEVVAFGGTSQWSIFTVGMDKSWRKIHCPAKFFPMINNCVHSEGVIYYVNFNDDESVHGNHIAAFDVGEENFRMISYPREVKLHLTRISLTIVEINGEVALLDHGSFHNDGKILVHVLIDGTIWMMRQTIELPSEFKQNCHHVKTFSHHYRFTSTSKGEIVLIPFLKINSSCMCSFMFFFDTKKKEWIKFELCGIGQRNFKEVWGSVLRNVVETLGFLK